MGLLGRWEVLPGGTCACFLVKYFLLLAWLGDEETTVLPSEEVLLEELFLV